MTTAKCMALGNSGELGVGAKLSATMSIRPACDGSMITGCR
jgi:hypothetical protein